MTPAGPGLEGEVNSTESLTALLLTCQAGPTETGAATPHKQHDVIEDFVNKESFLSGKNTLRKVFAWCISIELIGAAALAFSWSTKVDFNTLGDRVFSSIFHSVSAFNNAGITLFTDGLAHPNVSTNWATHWIVTILVFVGAFAFGLLR